MQARLAAGHAAVVQALYGMGGVGKTQLAAEYIGKPLQPAGTTAKPAPSKQGAGQISL